MAKYNYNIILQVVYNILDFTGINVWILYKETTGENISRKDFLFQLAKQLAGDYKNVTEQFSVKAEEISSSITSQNQAHISIKYKQCQIAYVLIIKRRIFLRIIRRVPALMLSRQNWHTLRNHLSPAIIKYTNLGKPKIPASFATADVPAVTNGRADSGRVHGYVSWEPLTVSCSVTLIS
ncbi:LOW QUALITY PROTEIN: piggyBac transposable element-derived protein 4-like [Vespula maculifrons]|uniref:PiggyBac transposable element-derived protein 4-like n=1 Tax=Vespula maculifrons TaxID=7453 RepID=A0ABD2ASN2_VESMC